MEKLAQYLKENSIRRSAFAARIGVAKGTMTEMLQCKYPPSLRVAVMIEDETSGAISVRDLLQ